MKYIIDIEDTPKDGLYKATNFKTLVFDEYGLSRLEKMPEPPKEEPLMVGDEVVAENGHAVFIVTHIGYDVAGIDFAGNTYSYIPDEIDRRTGRRFNVVFELDRGDTT